MINYRLAVKYPHWPVIPRGQTLIKMNSHSIASHRKATESDCLNHGIDRTAHAIETLMMAAFENGQEFWYIANPDGTFWATACNGDEECFTTADDAAQWIYRQANLS